jgi:hypothetical protein
MLKGSFTPWPMLAALLLSSCAGQVAPPGGPPDTVPPRIIRTEPDSNAVDVRPDRVVLEFSEYVERRSVEESVFFSPDLGVLEFDWSGRELEITFAQPLRDSLTYVLNVGTDVVDVRAGNRMASGFSLAFSTGSRIDDAAIAGRVYDASPEGVFVFAYRLEGRNPDTLNPATVRPDYITQTGRQGRFLLSHLAEGRYRLIAVRDQYKDLLYQKQVDAYGVGRQDYDLSESEKPSEEIWFRLAREDTTHPFLSSASPGGGRQLLLRFSEPLDSLSLLRSDVEVQDTLSGQAQPVQSVYPTNPGWSDIGVLLGTAPGQGQAYRVSVTGARDTAGNLVDPHHASVVVLGTGEPDTVLPRVDVSAIPDSVRGIARDAGLLLRFSEPVDSQAVLSALSLSDTSLAKVAFNHRWLYSTRLLIVPRAPLHDASWYALGLPLDAVIDAENNVRTDTTLVVHFKTLDPRETGEITGRVLDSSGEGLRGPLHIEAVPLNRTGPVSSVLLGRPGSFTLREVREGRYRLDAFEDADSSGAYSYGLPFPFLPSERFGVYRDTLRVRARWTFENAEVELGR